MSEQPIKRLSFHVDEPDYKRLRLHTMHTGESHQDFVKRAVLRCFKVREQGNEKQFIGRVLER